MQCDKCGAVCGEDERFCSACGAPLGGVFVLDPLPFAGEVAHSAPTRSKRPFRPKRAAVIAAGAAAVLVLALVLFLLLRAPAEPNYLEYGEDTVAILPSMGSINDLTYRFFAGETVFSGEIGPFLTLSYSISRDLWGIIDDDGTLYTVTADGIQTLCENAASVTVSSAGAGIAYTDSNGVLYLWQRSGEAAAEVDSGVTGGAVVLSPDGRSVAYILEDDGGSTLLLSRNGKTPVTVRQDAAPLALDNDGRLYFLRDGGLCYYDGKEDFKLAAALNQAILNADQSEVLFWQDEALFLTTNGSDPVKLVSSPLTDFAMPTGGLPAAPNTLGVHSFRGTCFVTEKGAYRITDDLETVKFAGPGDGYTLSRDGKHCIYYKGGDLYYVADTGAEDQPVRLTEDAALTACRISEDCSAFYYLDGNGTLFHQKGTDEAVSLADGVERFVTSKDTTRVYYTTGDGALYTSGGGGEPTAVAGVEDISGVFYAGMLGYCMTVDSENRSTYYVIKPDGSLTPIYRDEAAIPSA